MQVHPPPSPPARPRLTDRRASLPTRAPADQMRLMHLALVDLYLAHRAAGEDYAACFARIGAPGYAAILRRAFGRNTAATSRGFAPG